MSTKFSNLFLLILAIAGLSISQFINAGTYTVPTKTIDVGNRPHCITFDGTHIWVGNELDKTVSKIDPNTNKVVGTFKVGGGPIAIISDGKYIWVGNNAENTVTKLDRVTGKKIGTYFSGSGVSASQKTRKIAA